ncbi:helix-turn-helix domain-containing protein [Haloarcula onubensis]|uniref:Helix-turn-helix domain-containing protein n=1 Tax=Haloarcula onubensis TaxID=2950539 RepID=A0ABU2FPR4_9EURY|nr:helix-turn-helix domain-containing protein [Halomicroarcula sp. S3CR25-11]MDS0282749.1 helix-turn-helix domain-containing protein [Halomicroarcula sp. S3CR25-11]
MNYEANRRVETSARTFAIVERLSALDRVGVSALADELGMSKGIVHNHLCTLRELGYVRKVDDRYQLSPKLLGVGLRARSNAPLYRFGHDLCREFAGQADTGVALCQHTDGDCLVVDAYEVAPTTDLAVGTALGLSGSLVGLAIRLASGEGGVDAAGEYDIDALRASFEAAGSVTGPFSTSHEQDGVAVPVLGTDGACHGGVGVLLPEGHTDQRRQRLTEATRSLRTRIERRFDAEWPGERSFATEKHSWVG